MSKQENGGPAFPSSWNAEEDGSVHAFGMTLRDYFAAKAMEGFCACSGRGSAEDMTQSFAKSAYKIADAMLKAREA